jgi:hypothetical protein
MGLMIVARDKKGIIKQDINMDRINGKRLIEVNKLKEQESKIKKGKKA